MTRRELLLADLWWGIDQWTAIEDGCDPSSREALVIRMMLYLYVDGDGM